MCVCVYTYICPFSPNGEKWAVLCIRDHFVNSVFAFGLEILDYRIICAFKMYLV